MIPIRLLIRSVLTFNCLAHKQWRKYGQESGFVLVTLLWSKNGSAIVTQLSSRESTRITSSTPRVSAKVVCFSFEIVFRNIIALTYYYFFLRSTSLLFDVCCCRILPSYEKQIVKDLLAKPQRICVDLFVLKCIKILWIQMNFACSIFFFYCFTCYWVEIASEKRFVLFCLSYQVLSGT